MTYRYVLLADTKANRYSSAGWAGKDIRVVVDADDYESAKTEALRILPPPGEYLSWHLWGKTIESLPDPVVPIAVEPPFSPPPTAPQKISRRPRIRQY